VTGRVVIVGAGLAGLVAGYRLRRTRPDVDVVAVDAAAAPGGKVRTDVVDGYRIEHGPQAYQDEEGGPLGRLVADLGLEGEVVKARPEAAIRYLVRNGRLVRIPQDPLRLALSPLLSFDGFVRLAREPFVPGRPAGAPPESVAAWARRRVGREAASRLVDAMVAGVFAGDPARLELESAFPRIHELEMRYGGMVRGLLAGGMKRRGLATFRAGLGALPAALARALGPALRLRARAVRLGPEGGAWRVTLEGGEAIAAATVILASPALATERLVKPLDAPLARLLDGIEHADVAAVSLGYDVAAFPAGTPQGFGFLAPQEAGLRTLGCLYPSSAFPGAAPPGKVQLRALVGGARDPAAAALPDDDLVALVRREVEPLVGPLARPPEHVRIHRHPRGIPQYTLGHGARLAAIDARLRALPPGLVLAGSGYRGISLSDVAASGERAAEAGLALAAARTAPRPWDRDRGGRR